MTSHLHHPHHPSHFSQPSQPSQPSLTLLHTSDWHLGRRLYGKARYDEFSQFLDWLQVQIIKEQVDVLIVAGDIFDTMTPSHTAQTLYYQFLYHIAQSPCQNVVIIAGNHDSPSFLEAPKALLKVLNVHVIGTANDSTLTEEIITLYSNTTKEPLAIIGAVPYLRDKDIRTSQAGESTQQKEQQLIKGIRHHYDTITQLAIQQQQALHQNAQPTKQPNHRQSTVPIILTGHLFTSGATTTQDDGVRDLYVGSLGHIPTDLFSKDIDYVALGHLHVPQMVKNCSHIRYSGSPIAMGFGEAKQQKQVCLIRFFNTHPDHPCRLIPDDAQLAPCQQYRHITQLPVPCFQPLQQIKGDWQTIKQSLTQLKTANANTWLEIIYDDEQLKSQQNLKNAIDELTKDTQLQVLKIKNNRTYHHVMQKSQTTHQLQDLTPTQIFEHCLQTNHITDQQQIHTLKTAYAQILHDLNDLHNFNNLDDLDNLDNINDQQPNP